MGKLLLYTFIFLSFIGCSQKIALKDLDMSKAHELSIVNTRKAQLLSSNGAKVIIVATYLNPINVDFVDSDKENFLIGIYNASENSNGANPLYKITLNKSVNLESIKKIDPKSKYLKIIPLVNKWADYYLLEFPRQDSKKLVLSFENSEHAKALLNFEKEF